MSQLRFHSEKLFAWWYDLLETTTLSQAHMPVLDGVRGLAVLIVLASHTSFLGLWGQGGIGVWLFFNLSGFLLSQPFLTEPTLTPQRYIGFLFNRCRRILPAYWVVISIFYLPVSGLNLSNFLHNLLMVKSDWHLWSIKQEMILYGILPFILAFLPLFGGRLVWFAGYIVIIGLAFHLFVGANVLVTDQDRQLRLYALPFLLGMALGALYQSPKFQIVASHQLAPIIGNTGLLVFIGLLFASAPHIYEPVLNLLLGQMIVGDPPGWKYHGLFALACAVFLFCALLPGSLTKTALTWLPLRACGILGYSIYLIHYFVLLILPTGWPRFTVTAVITFPLACALYGFVERAFWKRRSSVVYKGSEAT